MSDPECTSLERLIAEVRAMLESGRTNHLSEYLNTTHIQPDSLAPYLHHNEAHYTRNLIFKNGQFEMLALCWGVGHRSWVHNHRGQHCWMSVIEGWLAIRNYKRLGCDQQLRTVKLEAMPEDLISAGSAAKVDPIEPVHLVWNPAEFNQPAVSLHIYSLPFDTCVVYDGEQGICREMPLFYTSERGLLTNRHQGGKQLADLPRLACTLSAEGQDAHCGVVDQNLVQVRQGAELGRVRH